MRGAAAWPWAIGAVLALTVVANVMLLLAANAPGAAQVEPDYYRRALAWDSTQVERSRSAALGWRATARFAPGRDRTTVIEVELRDAQGSPVTGARLETVAIHNLLPGEPARWSLVEASPGRYRAEVTPRHEGRWELRVGATRGHDRFVAVLHADLAPVSERSRATAGTAR